MNRQQTETFSKKFGKPEGLYLSEAEFDFSKDFKQEWNPAETKGVETWINELFAPILPKIWIRESVEDYFGLAYTSSSSCAMLGVCNVKHYLTDTHYINFFALNDAGYMYIVCQDEEENQIIFGIE